MTTTSLNTESLTLHPRAAEALSPALEEREDDLASVEASPLNEEELGATTAEYAILTLAAVAFAGVLAVVVKSGPVQDLLAGIIERALSN